MNRWLNAIELEGKFVKLEPLEPKHRDDLVAAVSDGELWKLWFSGVPSEETIDSYIETAMSQFDRGEALPFVVIRKSDSKVVGCTRICRAEFENRRVEIGYTWYSKSVQRTVINSETKLLILTHAFEELQVNSVVFQTHFHNFKSRNAILRLGAKQDGILRNHRIIDGIPRDTAIFSILENEWVTVKHSLSFRINQI